MVESEDEFAELCSKLLKRVKKSKPLEGAGGSTVSTAAKSRLKRPKAATAKTKAGTKAGKEEEPSQQAGGDPEKAGTRAGKEEEQEQSLQALGGDSEKESSGHGTESSEATPQPSGHTQTDVSGKESQEEAARAEQTSVKDLILERMQKFKRKSPIRMKLNSEEVNDEHIGPVEVTPEVLSDGDLAMALQMKEQQPPVSLEDQGLFFCQLCQKDLTGMSTVLREQHVNRCLDQGEGLQSVPVVPLVPSCPLCGKNFTTEKSRSAHLKRCAAKLEVPAQTLLNAVQRQAAEGGTEVPARAANPKRKGAPKQKEPSKKRKVAQTGAEMEDLMVAMALSRSMQEENTTPAIASVQPRGKKPPAEKKSRKKKEKPTPLLLLQAPEEAVQKLQKRMSMLMSEEPAQDHLITLPASHFWNILEEERETWRLTAGKKCVLWDISNMVDTRETISYYTSELNPPITPWKPATKKVPASQPRSAASITPTLPARTRINQSDEGNAACPVTTSKDLTPPTASQQDRQALLDLADLAGEGMTLTQWNCPPSSGNSNSQTGPDSPAAITCSGFIPSDEKATIRRRTSRVPRNNNSAVVTLAADFIEMVNNPHLSDAQLQTDCGEVLSVHMFVLYARCPLLVEAVHTEGFLVDEAGSGRVKRLLLNDVSAEAALCFLRFLYSANTDFPSHCLTHVCELARRFGVKSLIDVCEDLVGHPDRLEDVEPMEEEAEDQEEDDGGERADNFQELLRSMWVDEDKDLFTETEAGGLEEEEPVDDGCVGEGDLEEIYEFAATQRRIPEELGKEGGSSSGSEEGVVANSHSPRIPMVGEEEKLIGARNEQSKEDQAQIYAMNTSPFKVPLTKMNMAHIGKSSASSLLKSVGSSPTRPFISVSPVKSPKDSISSPNRPNSHRAVSPHARSPLPSPILSRSQPTPEHPVSALKSPARSPLSSPILSRSQPTPENPVSPLKSPARSPLSSPILSRSQPTPEHPVSPLKSPARSQLSSPILSRSQPSSNHSVSPVKSPAISLLSSPSRSQPTPVNFVSPVKSLSSPSQSRSQPTPDHSVSPKKPHKSLPSPARSKVKKSPLQFVSPVKSPALHPASSPSWSRSGPPSSSPPWPRSQPSPGLTAPLSKSPSGKNSVMSESSVRRLFPDELCKPSESSSEVVNERTVSIIDTISLISPEREDDDDPEADLFSQHSPAPLDDSYDRMFSETCGEYEEPSGLSETNSRIQAASSLPILTSSPSATQQPKLPELGSSPKLPELGSSPDIQRTQRSSSVTQNKKTPPSPCTPSKSPTPSKSSTALSQKQDVILILSSDEEGEDSPGNAEAKESNIFKSIKDSPASFSCLNSSAEISWLVPATPMTHVTATGITQLQASRIPKSPESPKSCSRGGSQNSFVSPTQADSSNRIMASFSMRQLMLSNSPEKPAEACRRETGGVISVPTSPSSGGKAFVKKPQTSNTPEKQKDTCFSTSSNVSCVPSSPPSTAGSHVFVQQPLFPNTPEKQKDACFSTGSNVSCVPSSPPSTASSHVFIQHPSFSNTQEKPSEACSRTGSKVSCVLSSPPSTQPLLTTTPEKLSDACTSAGSKASRAPLSPASSVGSNNVFEVVDSEDEAPAAESQAESSAGSFQVDYDEPPIPVDDDLWFCGEETPTRPYSSPEHNMSFKDLNTTPTKSPTEDAVISNMSPLQEGGCEPDAREDAPHTPPSESCLNSKLWDEWEEEEEPELPAFLPLSQRLNQVPNMQTHLKTPVSIVRKRELPPKVPITPLPEYSDMDTPILKKELNKFGVRALPKKQMVLKLKEIFRYTHQVMSSDSEEEVPSLKPGHRHPAAAVQSPIKKRQPPATKATGNGIPQRGKKKATSVCSAPEAESGEDQPLNASQESTTSSVAASDVSSRSQSSGGNEFETAFADEDDEDPVPASQAASKEEQKVEAVRRFIEERPDLQKRILLFQPLDLAALHAELKQSGIKIAAGKLLDFLDGHCVTFTTAAARKEKKTRGRRKAAKRL